MASAVFAMHGSISSFAANGEKYSSLPLGGNFAQSRVPQAVQSLDSVVLISEIGFSTSPAPPSASSATLVASGNCPLFLVIPSFLRDGMYDLVAFNRYRLFGSWKVAECPRRKRRRVSLTNWLLRDFRGWLRGVK